MNDRVYCPECGSDDCARTTPVDEEGQAEFHCEACGNYFVAFVPDDEEAFPH